MWSVDLFVATNINVGGIGHTEAKNTVAMVSGLLPLSAIFVFHVKEIFCYPK